MHEGLREQVAKATRDVLREQFGREHLDEILVQRIADRVLPILSLVSDVSVPGGPTDAFHLSCPSCGQAIDLIPEQGSSRSQPEADKCSLTLPCSDEGAGGSGALTVETAAIRIGDAVFTLPRPNRHHNVMWWLSALGVRSGQMHEQGFVLSNGQFATRTLAAKLALSNGQIEKLISPPDLYSEDLWDGGADLPSIDAIRALQSSLAPPSQSRPCLPGEAGASAAALDDPSPPPPAQEEGR